MAKWLRGLTLTANGEPGFWATHGYHNHDHEDPWQEQPYGGH